MKRSPRSRRRLTAALTTAAVALGVGAAALAAPAVFAPAVPAGSDGSTLSAAPVLAAAAGAGCPEIETIAVRGTTERQGGGIVAGPLASALQDQLAQTVRTHDLVYPASFAYQSSVRQGVAALRDRLAATAAECADTRFVLIGYSQGADVIGDALAADDLPAADRIGAVTLFGDPAFNSSEPFVTGSFRAGTDGIFPRTAGALDAVAEVAASFCNSDDTVCQRGGSGFGHFRYGADRQQAVEFVGEALG